MTTSEVALDGLVIFAKKECPTCNLVQPVARELAKRGRAVTVFVQDDTSFMEGLPVEDDTSLKQSFLHNIEAVPTFIRFANGREADRTVGWSRTAWERVAGVTGLGENLPAFQPGCGSKTREPDVFEHLVARYGETGLTSRRIEVGDWADPVEAAYERGWSDGLPVVPPTDDRILRMLGGTSRKSEEIVGRVPPNLAPCTVEKVAINAVMAGCKPEYMPIVLAALEAALEPIATLHGLLCTTCSGGPILIVNGSISRAVGMNSGINALGQGNRANATIGRALNLIVRNVGGGRPGELSRSTLGGPHKYTFCFAEDDQIPNGSPSPRHAVSRAAPMRSPFSRATAFKRSSTRGRVRRRSSPAPLPWRYWPCVIRSCANSPMLCSSCRLSTTASSEMPAGIENESKASCIRLWSVRARTSYKEPRASAKASIRTEPIKWSISFGRKVFWSCGPVARQACSLPFAAAGLAVGFATNLSL